MRARLLLLGTLFALALAGCGGDETPPLAAASTEAAPIPVASVSVVRESIVEVLWTLLEAIGLVILVMFLFLQNWRSTIIPAMPDRPTGEARIAPGSVGGAVATAGRSARLPRPGAVRLRSLTRRRSATGSGAARRGRGPRPRARGPPR